MINRLPFFMRNSKVYQEIFTSEEQQIHLLEAAIQDILVQLSIDTATWALDIYEKELEIKTDVNKPLSERRSVIKSKLRGFGKIDALQIKLVADAYTNGEVVISFNGHIVVKFTSKIGIPPNLQDLKSALEEIKPAHLKIDYLFRYLIVNEIHQVMTISNIQTHKLSDFAPFADAL
jgi:hypothetical protein